MLPSSPLSSSSSSSECSSNNNDDQSRALDTRKAAGVHAPHSHTRVRMTAYADEVAQLRDAVALLSREGGSSGVLEGKYLQQVRRVRELTVRLEKQRTMTHTLQQQVAQLQAQQQQQQQQQHGKRAHARDGKPTSGNDKDDATASAEHAQQTRVLRDRLDRVYQQLHERERHVDELRRENAQLCAVLSYELGVGKDEVLHAATATAAAASSSTSSPSAATRVAVTSNNNNNNGSGAVKESHGTSSSSGGSSSSTTGCNVLSSCSGGGWRGRVAQIVLLRGRVKDLERALADARNSAAAATAGGGVVHARTRHGNDSLACDKDDDNATAATTMTRMRVCSGTAASTSPCHDSNNNASDEDRSAGGNSTTPRDAVTNDGASTLRDVDDAAREHVAQLASQRLRSVRALEVALAQRDRDVRAARERHTALLARLHVVQRECAQLRQHTHVLLDKSSSDDALIAAYRDEVRTLRDALYKAKAATVAAGSSSGYNETTTTRAHGDDDSSSRSNADGSGVATVQRLRAEVEQLRQQLLLAQRQAATTSSSSSATDNNDDDNNNSEATLRAWVLSALAASAPDDKRSASAVAGQKPSQQHDDNNDEDDDEEDVSLFALRVAALLRAAHAHVVAAERRLRACEDASTTLLYERYAHLLDNVHARLLATPCDDTSNKNNKSSKSNNNNNDAQWMQKLLRALPPLEPFVLHENASLKQRVRTLTAVAEREAAAQQVLCDELLRAQDK